MCEKQYPAAQLAALAVEPLSREEIEVITIIAHDVMKGSSYRQQGAALQGIIARFRDAAHDEEQKRAKEEAEREAVQKRQLFSDAAYVAGFDVNGLMLGVEGRIVHLHEQEAFDRLVDAAIARRAESVKDRQ